MSRDHWYHVFIADTEAISFPTQLDALDRAILISTNRFDVVVKHHGRVTSRYRGGRRK